jgi:hypothetical protein
MYSNGSAEVAPERLFAALSVKYAPDAINAAWDYLYYRWIHNSAFEYTGEPYFEEYFIRNGKPVKLRLYLPIRRRGGEARISVVGNPHLRFIAATAEGLGAEERAANSVMEYIKEHYSYLFFESRQMYLQKVGGVCVCGIKVDFDWQILERGGIIDLRTNHDNYLLLESGVTGDYGQYAAQLSSFARENGIAADRDGIFMVYDAAKNFENMRVKMYCPIKLQSKIKTKR